MSTERGDKMTDTARLEKWIDEHGLKRNFIADKIGRTSYGLSLKIKGINDFTASEIAVFRDLGMTLKEVDLIFLNGK